MCIKNVLSDLFSIVYFVIVPNAVKRIFLFGRVINNNAFEKYKCYIIRCGFVYCILPE